MEPRDEKERMTLPSGVEVAMGTGEHQAPSSWAQRKPSERRMPRWRWWKWWRWTIPIRQEFSILQNCTSHHSAADLSHLLSFFVCFFQKRLRLLEDFHAPALTTAMLSQMVARILLDISFGCQGAGMVLAMIYQIVVRMLLGDCYATPTGCQGVAKQSLSYYSSWLLGCSPWLLVFVRWWLSYRDI